MQIGCIHLFALILKYNKKLLKNTCILIIYYYLWCMESTLVFKNGKAQIKEGKKVIAVIIDRVAFFAGITAKFTLFNPKFPFALQMNGSQAECVSLQDAIELFKNEL